MKNRCNASQHEESVVICNIMIIIVITHLLLSSHHTNSIEVQKQNAERHNFPFGLSGMECPPPLEKGKKNKINANIRQILNGSPFRGIVILTMILKSHI